MFINKTPLPVPLTYHQLNLLFLKKTLVAPLSFHHCISLSSPRNSATTTMQTWTCFCENTAASFPPSPTSILLVDRWKIVSYMWWSSLTTQRFTSTVSIRMEDRTGIRTAYFRSDSVFVFWYADGLYFSLFQVNQNSSMWATCMAMKWLGESCCSISLNTSVLTTALTQRSLNWLTTLEFTSCRPWTLTVMRWPGKVRDTSMHRWFRADLQWRVPLRKHLRWCRMWLAFVKHEQLNDYHPRVYPATAVPFICI